MSLVTFRRNDEEVLKWWKEEKGDKRKVGSERAMG